MILTKAGQIFFLINSVNFQLAQPLPFSGYEKEVLNDQIKKTKDRKVVEDWTTERIN